MWINLFCWTFRQKYVNEDGDEVPCSGNEAHQPFITWAVQDEAIAELCDAIINGHDAGCIKSRDMGASWLCLTVFHWFWQFVPNTTFKELSRKEEVVDSKGDMDSLFEKHRYLLRFQPSWIKPRRIRDNYMKLENMDIGTSIVGESTNKDAGQGGRKTAILLDEFGRVDNGNEIMLATADTTACRIVNSTPSGPGTEFHRLYVAKKIKFITMPWWRHPEKGKGAYQVLDDKGRAKWTNDWYQKECGRRDLKDIAQNLDMDFGQAGDVFFDLNELERHKASHAKPPLLAGRTSWVGDPGDKTKAGIVRGGNHRMVIFTTAQAMPPEERNRACLRLWIPLVDGRPPQHLTYAFGVDIANGSGGSNSVISVLALETNQIVAKFWDAFVSPEELAEVAAQMGVWFGGMRGPAYVCWENNGPGGIFGRKLVRMGYPHYYTQKIDDQAREKQTTKWGWHSNAKRKEVLLARYRECLKTDSIINPCEQSLKEAADYIYSEDGTLIPGKLKQEASGGRALHGDHVIADALTVLARDEMPRLRATAMRAPKGSYAWRREQHRARLKREKMEWAK